MISSNDFSNFDAGSNNRIGSRPVRFNDKIPTRFEKTQEDEIINEIVLDLLDSIQGMDDVANVSFD